MKVIVVDDKRQGAELVVDDFISFARQEPAANVGLATGGSMEPVYEALVRRVREGHVNLDQVRWFLLDEYLGIGDDNPARYRAEIHRQLVDPLGLDPTKLFGPSPDLALAEHEGQRYEVVIRDAGGIDWQFLGIGRDGHIGFNEPGSSLASRTRIKTLRPETRRDNARYFGGKVEAVPTQAITQGIATIGDARRLVLVAWGEAKAAAVARCVEGPLSAMTPASVLQLHPRVTVIVDEPAAGELRLKDHYCHS